MAFVKYWPSPDSRKNSKFSRPSSTISTRLGNILRYLSIPKIDTKVSRKQDPLLSSTASGDGFDNRNDG